MSSSEGHLQPTTTTEIFLVTGERYRVRGEVKHVERTILDAARGSIMQLAWLIEVPSGTELAVNPEHIVAIRAVRA
jgi:uncharacterized protein YlzI (FlbEa/FlbD family)